MEEEESENDIQLSPVLLKQTELLFYIEENDLQKFTIAFLEVSDITDFGENEIKESVQILLRAVCEKGRSAFLKIILEDPRVFKYADLNLGDDERGNTYLTLAAHKENSGCLKPLLEAGSSVFHRNNDNISALDISCERGHVENARVLLSHVLEGKARNAYSGDGVRKYLYTALTTAVEFHQLHVVKLFTEAHVDVNINFDPDIGTALHCAAEAGSSDSVDLLLKSGAQIESLRKNREQTPLMVAAQHGHVDIIQRLLEAGADINKQTEECSTPLILACHFGHADCVSRLIEKGADVNIVNKWGFNALFMGTDLTEILKQLLDAGAKVNQVCGERDEVPLHLAAVVGNMEGAKMLLSRGADVNIRTNENENALWLSVWKRHENMTKMLIQHNSELDVATKACQVFRKKYLTVEVALGYGDFRIAEMLIRAGCKRRNWNYFNETDDYPVESLPYLYYREECLLSLAANEEASEKIMRLVTEVQPLRHLSRLAIRKILKTPLLSKLLRLEIPRHLVGYLIFIDL